MDCTMGSTNSANRSASRIDIRRPFAAASARVRWVAEFCAGCFARGEGGPGAFRDQSPFLLGKRGIEVQHERVGIGTELGDDEWHALGHQAGDEGDVAREAIELGDHDGALRLPRQGEGCCKLRPPVERIRTLAGLDLGELGEDGDALGFGEAGDRRSLRLDAQARSTLPLCRDPVVSNRARHLLFLRPGVQTANHRLQFARAR